MIESPLLSGDGSAASDEEADRVEQIVSSGPRGAIAVAGIATAIVIGMWYAFYFLVFLPRGVIH
ncbi:hypothetical protein [Paraburkholderia sp. 35.1]|uniref:hypothetical protein n=1 Tax=unclassified Paraburkholderia TaxID=2615204 RepID=UPI003D22AA4B